MSISDVAFFVVGATGVGKTRLGVELGQRCQGEVVSADSMQVYQGADIMTAKASAEERANVPHHLIDVVSPLRTDWHVGEYQRLAGQTITQIHSRGNVPFIVGGTMYYVEAVLFDQDFPVLAAPDLPVEEHWSFLQTHDPAYAAITPPTNHRKIENAVKYILATGLPYSQKGRHVRLRYPRSAVIWLRCRPETLEVRVRERVGSMQRLGGLEEVQRFLQMSSSPNFSKGVLQSIGYKEFREYLEGKCSLDQATEALVQATLKYARKQEKWIHSRLTPHMTVHELDTSDLSTWPQLVTSAVDIVHTTLQTSANIVFVERMSQPVFECQKCSKKVIGQSQWRDHLHSKAHRKRYCRKPRAVGPTPPSFLFDEDALDPN